MSVPSSESRCVLWKIRWGFSLDKLLSKFLKILYKFNLLNYLLRYIKLFEIKKIKGNQNVKKNKIFEYLKRLILFEYGTKKHNFE